MFQSYYCDAKIASLKLIKFKRIRIGKRTIDRKLHFTLYIHLLFSEQSVRIEYILVGHG